MRLNADAKTRLVNGIKTGRQIASSRSHLLLKFLGHTLRQRLFEPS